MTLARDEQLGVVHELRKVLESAGVGCVQFITGVLPILTQELADEASARERELLERRVTGDNAPRRRRQVLEEDPWLDEGEAATYLGTTPNALRMRRRRGHVRHARAGGRSVRYRKSWLDASMQVDDPRVRQRRGRTSDTPIRPRERRPGGTRLHGVPGADRSMKG